MDVSGMLRDSLVLSHALPCRMIATAVCPQVFRPHRVQLGRAQTGEHLLRHVKFGGLRQVSDIAGMDDERGLLGHPVHEIDGLREGPVDIGIRVLIEASVCVADLMAYPAAQHPVCQRPPPPARSA